MIELPALEEEATRAVCESRSPQFGSGEWVEERLSESVSLCSWKIFRVRRNSLDNGNRKRSGKGIERQVGKDGRPLQSCLWKDRADQKLVSPGLASRIINVGTRIAPREHPLLPLLYPDPSSCLPVLRDSRSSLEPEQDAFKLDLESFPFFFLKSVWFEFKRDMDFPARSRLIQEDVWGRKRERKRRDWFLSLYLLFHLCWKELLHFCSFKNAGFRFIRLKKKKKVDGISGNELLYDLSPNLI